MAVRASGKIYSKFPETNLELGEYARLAFQVRNLFSLSSTFSKMFWRPPVAAVGPNGGKMGVPAVKLYSVKSGKWADLGRYATISRDSFADTPTFAQTQLVT